MESSDKMWSVEGNGKPLLYFCLENPMNTMKWQKDTKLKDELPKSVVSNMLLGKRRQNFRKNEDVEPKWKGHPVVDMSMKVKSDAVENNTAQEPGMLGP